MDTHINETVAKAELLDAISTSLNCLFVMLIAVAVGIPLAYTSYRPLAIVVAAILVYVFCVFFLQAFKFSRWRSDLVEEIDNHRHTEILASGTIPQGVL